MRRILLIPLLTVLFLGIAKGQETTTTVADAEEAKRQVLKIEDDLNQAILARDTEVLDRIFAGDMAWTARGALLNKAQVLADFRSGNLHFNALKHDDIRLRVFGSTVVVTGYSTSSLQYQGKVSNGPRLFTSVYVKLDGRWQLVAHQVTDLAK